MRVLHLLKTSVGASWGLRQMRELVKLGVDVDVALPAGPMVEQYEQAGVRTHKLQTAINIGRPWKNIAMFGAFRRLVDEVHPDIIHSHFVATTLTMRAALGRQHPTRRIFQVPGPLHLEHSVYRTAEIMSAGNSDLWLASCQWTRACYVKHGIDRSRIGLVYYGVDVDAYGDRGRGRLRREFAIETNVPVVGTVAYFYAPKRYLGQGRGVKGHEDLIDAIDMAGRTISNLHCVIVGGPWAGANRYMESVKKLARSKKNATFLFTGFRRDVKELYADFDLAVHASHSENVGGAVESMLCGVPTIATEVGGFPDLVKPNETGWLVPKASPVELAKTIIEAIQNPALRDQYAKAGRALAAEMFDVRENAKDLYRYYQKVMQTGLVSKAGPNDDET